MDIEVLLKKKKNVKSSVTKLQNKTEEEIEKLNNVGLLARKNRFLEFRTEIKGYFGFYYKYLRGKGRGNLLYGKERHFRYIRRNTCRYRHSAYAFCSQLDFEVKNQGSSHSLVSARSAESETPTLSLPIFSGVTEEWLAFSDLFEAAVSNNNDAMHVKSVES
ncbi:DUF1758 domain-containing protein [Trichonephila clavipes]|nr:DUF1758 domain-containing protein [Trichonephila clavipes]